MSSPFGGRNSVAERDRWRDEDRGCKRDGATGTETARCSAIPVKLAVWRLEVLLVVALEEEEEGASRKRKGEKSRE